ncbi:MAG: ABC transporter ATP-binding protein [Bacillota bacterium]
MDSLKRFLRYVKPYWHYIALAALGGFIKFLLPMVFPQIMRYFIDDLLTDAGSLSESVRGEYLKQIHYYSLVMIGLYIFVWCPGTFIRHYFSKKISNRVIFDLRNDLFQHIHKMSAPYFDEHRTGAILTRLIDDTNKARKLLMRGMTNIWIDGSIVLVLLIILFKMNVVLTLLSLSIMPLFIFSVKSIAPRVKETSREVQDELEDIQGDAQEKISGAKVIRAFTMEKLEEKKFFRRVRKLYDFMMKRAVFSSFNNVINGGITRIAPVIIVWYSAYSIIQGYMTIGELTAFYAYLPMFYMPVRRFSKLNVVISNSMAAVDRIFEVFDEKPQVKEEDDAEKVNTLDGEIKIDNVTFSYNSDEKALDNIDLKINKGEKIALVGSSGAGKSTLVNLLPRFYDVDSGNIKIDNNDIRNFKLKSLRKNIGMVLQEPILFSGTIKENIKYGKSDASDQEVVKAAKAANAYEFIQGFSDGFETSLGENGTGLSGGQKQRITIARVFLKDPKILILDEATSSLDSRSENLIQDAIKNLMVGRTTFIIAHRLTTIMDVDKIIVMDDGKIEEIGSHKELLQKDSIYRDLFEEQFEDAMKYRDNIKTA